MTLVTISSKNQITLPVSYLRALEIKPGGKFLVDHRADELCLKPIKGSLTNQLAGSLNKYISKDKLGKSWKEIMRETQKARAKHVAEEE